MKILCLAALMAMAGGAIAGDSWLVLSGASHHFERDKKYNEQNIGLGFEEEISANWRIGAGWYRNSLYRTSVYAGATYLPLTIGPVRIGASAGLVSGYTMRPMPMIVPAAMIEGRMIGLNVILIPPVRQAGGGGLGLQIKVRLD